MVGVTARLASGVRKRMAIQVLGTRAVGEGAARASGACGLNKLVPMIRHLVLCSYCGAFNQLVTLFFDTARSLGCAAALGLQEVPSSSPVWSLGCKTHNERVAAR